MFEVTLAILAGGRGSRMGVPKDRLTIGGKPILQYLFERLKFIGPTLLVASPEHPTPRGCEAFDRVILDDQIGEGPLAGILAGLSAAKTAAVIFLSIDMPSISSEQLDFLRAAAGQNPKADGVLLRRADESAGRSKVEPFPCLIRTRAKEVVATHFAAGGRSVRSLLDLPHFISLEAPVSWPTSVWLNLNFPNDLQQIGAKLE
jgi:molybdopterin-guanine dinucleotide biosynthesis protein A